MSDNHSTFFTVFIFFVAIGIFAAPVFIFAQETITSAEQGGKAFIDFMNWLFSALLTVAAILAFAKIVIGGFLWIGAAGNTTRIDDAKDHIKKAIIGLILAFASWLILNTINPALVAGNLPDAGDPLEDPNDPVIETVWICPSDSQVNVYTDESYEDPETTCNQSCTDTVNGMKFSCQKITGIITPEWKCNQGFGFDPGPYYSKGQCGMFCGGTGGLTGQFCQWKGSGDPPQEETEIAYRCNKYNTVWPTKKTCLESCLFDPAECKQVEIPPYDVVE